MLTERDEERLIDYALGELDPAERYELSRLLSAAPKSEAAGAAEDYQALAALAGRALQQETTGKLHPSQNDRVMAELINLSNVSRGPALRFANLLKIAAAFLLMATLAGVMFWSAGGRLDVMKPPNDTWRTAKVSEPFAITAPQAEVPAPAAVPVPAPLQPSLMPRRGSGEDRPFVEQRYRLVESEEVPSISAMSSETSGIAVTAKPASTDYYAFAPPSAPASPPVALGQQLESLGYLGEPRSAGTRIYADFDGDGGRNEALSLQYQPSPGGEQYNAAPESAFQAVGQQPLSTFSIDVDTAGYSNVRRMLTQGQWPPAEAVRIEEMLNYFDYSYPQPTTADPFSVNVEMARCPWAPEHYLTKIGVQGKEIVQNDRPAANLVFLIDCSGSMEPANKLPLVRESMKALFAGLDARDRVGIVTYAGDARIALPSTSCDARETIVSAIDSLNAGGSTNGQAGIQQAYDMAAANFISGGVNRVILATDGDFNVGVTDTGSLLDMIAQRAKGKIFLTALGFGMGNLKDGRLEELADKGNGNYAYIDTFAEARKALGEDLQGTLVTIAKDVKIQVEFNPARVQAYRLIGYDNRLMAAQDFNNDQKDAGEIGAGHTVTTLYEIVPIGAPVQAGVDALKYQTPALPQLQLEKPVEPGTGEWMNVKLRYKQPEGDTSTKIEVPVTAEPSTIEAASQDMRLASGVAAFGLVLRNSQFRGNADLDMAQQLVTSSELGMITNAAIPNAADAERKSESRRELVDLIVRAKTLR